MFKKCEYCGVGLWEEPDDLCYACARRSPPRKDKQPLKLFKVEIPSQTIKGNYNAKKLVIGQITDYGFIQGREIIVLATDRDRLYKQCLRELGCLNPLDAVVHVTEIEGPFEHGFVIAYNQPAGL